MASEKSIYEIRLHEFIKVDEVGYVTRVPGGWIYVVWGSGDETRPVFVPFNNEFGGTIE